MKIKYDAVSHVGAVRTNNEDMALVFGAFIRDDAQRSMVPMQKRPRFSALIADGMGGYGGGEVASEMTLQSFDEFLTSLPDGLGRDDVVAEAKQWFARNNAAVMARAATSAELANMGTTLTGIFTYGPFDFLINAGDSRVYRFRFDTLRQLSTDHSERERLGDPTVPSNLIYNAVGIPDAFLDVRCLNEEFPMVDGDTYIICSDGLCDMISDEKIEQLLAEGADARRLVDAAIEAGGRDNCTVIMLQVSIPDDYDAVSACAAASETAPAEPEEPAPAEPAPVEVPVEVPVEAAIGFSIDEESFDEKLPPIDPKSLETPPAPQMPQAPAMETPTPTPPPFPGKEEEEIPPMPDESRTQTAFKLIKEGFNMLLKKK